MNCSLCGKAVPAGKGGCPECGTPLTQSDNIPAQDSTSPELPSRSDNLDELLRRRPSAIGTGARFVMMLVFGLMLLGLIVFFFVLNAKRRDAAPIFQIFFAIFGLAGLAMAFGGVRGLLRLTRSPLLRLPAVVAGKREKVTTSKYSDPVIYFLTIKTEDGRTKEHTVSESVFQEVREGDAGIAYLKGGYLLDFKLVVTPGHRRDKSGAGNV